MYYEIKFCEKNESKVQKSFRKRKYMYQSNNVIHLMSYDKYNI